MNISPLGIATGYIEADTEARKEEKEFLRDTLKTGIANWNTFNMGQQSKQQAELSKTRDLVEQLKVAIPTDAFSHLPPEEQKAARSNAIISIAKGGENSVKGFLTNKNNFLNNAQTKAIGKNGFGYNQKLQTQKFFNTQFTFNDEVMYTDVDEWSIQNAMDKFSTNKFDTNTVVQSMGNRYKIDNASVNNYVEQLKLAHTGGAPIGLMRTDPDANTTHNGVVYHAGSVMPLGEAAMAAGAVLDLDYKNATFDARVASEVDKSVITNSQAAIAKATTHIDIQMANLQRSKITNDIELAEFTNLVNKKTQLEQISAIINNSEATKFGANGTLAQQYNLNIATIDKLTHSLATENNALRGLTAGSEEYIAKKVKVDDLQKQLSDEYALGSSILTAVEVYNQASAYGTNMGTVDKLSDFFTNADYRATTKEMATFLGAITGQGFDLDPSTGVVLWTSDSVEERLALNQATYVASTMVRDEMKKQGGNFNYLDALNAVKDKVNTQSWLDTITLDNNPVLKLIGDIKIPGFETEPLDIQNMMSNLKKPLTDYKLAIGSGIQVDMNALKIMRTRFKTQLMKYYRNNNPGNAMTYKDMTAQATALSSQYFQSFGFDLD